eukprot:13661997-Alexandrium_andersonii.AAC.1
MCIRDSCGEALAGGPGEGESRSSTHRAPPVVDHLAWGHSEARSPLEPRRPPGWSRAAMSAGACRRP